MGGGSVLSLKVTSKQSTGRLTVLPDSIVHSLVYDPGTHRVSAVRVVDTKTKAQREYKAKVVFLCACTTRRTRW